MNAKLIRVLLAEDNLRDAILISEMLKKAVATRFEVSHAECLDDALKYIQETAVDIVLLNLSFPGNNGFDTFTGIYAYAPQVPVIVLTSSENKKLALRIIREGAQDYLIKEEMDSSILLRSIRYAIERGLAREKMRKLQYEQHEAIRKSADHCRMILETTSDGAWTYEPTENEMYFSPGCGEMLGFSSDEMKPEIFSWKNRIHPNDKPGFISQMKAHLEGKTEQFRAEFRIRNKAGHWQWVMSRGKAMGTSKKGTPIHVLGTYTDISDQKQMEEELIRAKIQAEDTTRAKSEFLANMSHEIRTPISCIIGMTEMTLGMELGQKQRENLKTIKDSSKLLLSIINDILDFSKIEAGKLELCPEDFDFLNFIEKTISTFTVQARKKKIDLDFLMSPDIPRYLHGDALRLEQIINNLLSNALKFTGEGIVFLEARKLTQAGSTLTLLFSVTDTGIGIPKDKQSKLFRSFSQLDNSYSKTYIGTGLGLAISKKLTEMMGGSIWVESKPDEGSIFFFTAKFQEARSDTSILEQQTKPRFEDPMEVPPLTILLAEDNKVNQKFISHFLTEARHAVYVVSNGEEALDALEKMKFDMVLMDVQMPKMDGMEAVRRIRASESECLNPDIPIIALTAYAMKGDRERFLEAGMDDYIAKPIDMDELKFIISRVFSSQGNHRHAVKTNPKPKVLDRAAALRRFRGNETVLQECLIIFAEEIEKRGKLFREAFNGEDFEEIETHAHFLKGISLNLGAESCHVFSEKLEYAAREKNSDDIQLFYPILEQELRKVHCLLQN